MSQPQDAPQDTPRSQDDAADDRLVVFLDDDPLLSSGRSGDGPTDKPPTTKSRPPAPPAGPRLVSLDAYRGFVMLAMASGALGLATIVGNYGSDPGLAVTNAVTGEPLPGWWAAAWHELAYQFSHVAWVGCSFWDLIQPSFMFMVGVAMPFSFAKRVAQGQSPGRRFAHVLFRALVLIALGVFLSSNWGSQTNFTFVNVLTQIGLGYAFVYLLLGRPLGVQLLAAGVILVGYWAWFYQHEPTRAERRAVTNYLKQEKPNGDPEHARADFGSYRRREVASQWNKHLNAAASYDRQLLNLFPRDGETWGYIPEKIKNNDMTFMVNAGGYQTLNFIPSMATMIFGVMAGQLLMSRRRRKVLTLVLAGLGCFAVSMALDTKIWPAWMQIHGYDWSWCPTVKRIWTPTWAVFSTGWTLLLLAAFYWVIDVKGFRAWAFPLKVVGMNSIAMYCMAQLLKPWIRDTAQKHLFAVLPNAPDAWYLTFGAGNIYGPFWQSVLVLSVLWLVCLWLYRNKIFIRI